ncbi:MAG TPA: DUF2752 domain-containing protein [Thermoguttaceae bacterium]|nr:DUF2752 domain-containing protein [Thermoguttaceae bacterium]
MNDVEAKTVSRFLVSHRAGSAGVVMASLLGALILFAHDPANSSLFPACPFRALTGLHCPGCGTLRALHQLLHGNLAASFSLNPLMVVCLPVVAYWLVSCFLRAVNGRGLPSVLVSAIWIYVLLGVIVLFWVLRNVPHYPFSLLAQ